MTTTRMLASGASSDSAIAAVTALIILRMFSGGRPSRMDTNAMGTATPRGVRGGRVVAAGGGQPGPAPGAGSVDAELVQDPHHEVVHDVGH